MGFLFSFLIESDVFFENGYQFGDIFQIRGTNGDTNQILHGDHIDVIRRQILENMRVMCHDADEEAATIR